MKKYKFDTKKYKFQKIFQDLYGVSDLEGLHKYTPGLNMNKLENDSSSILHKIYYSNFERDLRDEYERFVKNEITSIIRERVYLQKIPCVRFSLPGYKWLTEYHRDGDYKHPPQELNVNLAITSSANTASLHIEEIPGSNKYIRLEQKYGEFTFINHIECKHGAEINREGKTMISLDFRMIKESDAKTAFESDKGSVNLGIKFSKGNYFTENPL